MPDNSTEPPQHVREIVDLLLCEMSSAADVQTKHYESTVAFTERLLLLNGGTLTLSFTIAAGFSGHLVNGQHIGHLASLIWAWRLLVFSIFCCLYFNGYLINTIANFGGMITKTRIKSAIERLKIAAGIEVDITVLDTDIDKSRRSLVRTSRLAVISGILAKASTLLAFCFLLHFVQTNVEILFAGR